MAATVIALRPRPVPASPARPVSSYTVPGPVSVEWDEGRELYVVACYRCTETALTSRLDEADELAEAHRCDPELAALLAQVTGEVA